MRISRSSALVFGLAAVFFITAMSAIPGYCKTVELTYSIFFPATHANTILATEWAKEIEKRTNGAVKINMFPGATLTPADQCYDGVVKGISDVGMSVLSYTKGRFPLTEVIDMPLGYKSGYQVTRLCNAYYDKFKPKELDDVKVMYLHGHGPGIVNTKKPVEKMEDLKGMKLRCSGTSAKVATALGATPVAMPQTEAYDALQKGVVDGVLSPIETLTGWKFAEVVKSTTQDFGAAYSLAFFVVMNKKKWESLPKEAQDVIQQVNKEWIEKTGKMWDLIDKEGAEYTLSKGNKIIQLSKEEDARWAKAVRPILDEYVAAMKAKGLPGEESLNFCQEWL
ncbi:MAG: TRAP transporter substrate-binding protein, partial [Desulfomonile tiedjei]|nr:TRAP transporter substrate-binding protein [Desulfomonile tiedjei]